jgi:hypothetical protein
VSDSGAVTLTPEAYIELVGRLVALRNVAEELSDAFDDPRAAAGAKQMLASIDRALHLLEYRGERITL